MIGTSAVLLASFCGGAFGQAGERAADTIAPVPFERLSDQNLTVDGRRALEIRPGEWRHYETPHFVLHFFNTFIAAPVAAEAEFYFRFILGDLGVDEQSPGTATGKGKVHVYLFERQEDWDQFKQDAYLEIWTGAVHIDGALFVPRYPEFKWKGNALGHEIAHLLLARYVGTRPPLWLNEGYAEEVSNRGYATFYRARGYFAPVRVPPPPTFLPLERLTRFAEYPPEAEVTSFYRESHALCAFFRREAGQAEFVKFLTLMSRGMPFSSALHEAFGLRWDSPSALEAAFKRHLESLAPDSAPRR